MVRGAKVAAGVPHDGDVELLHGLDDVLAEAALVGEGVARIVDAAVDASAHVPRDGLVSEGAWVNEQGSNGGWEPKLTP